MKIPSMMKAAIVRAPGQLEVAMVPTPVINDDEVLVEVKACGVCGSDILGYHGEHPRITLPRILGHEFSGVVVQAGKDVTNIKVGDRVTADINIACGKCWACRHGYSNNHCINNKGCLGHSMDGAMAQYIKFPEANALILPDNVDFVQGAVAETLAVGYNAVRVKAKVGAGDIIVIIGAGAVGLDVLLAAKASGAYIIVSDIIPNRLDIAKKIGANRVVNAQEEDLHKVVKEITDGRGADKVFETVGGNSTGTVRTAVEITRPCGTVVVLGTNSKNSSEFPVTTFKENEITMQGSRGIPFDCLERALFMLKTEQVDINQIISHTFPLSEIKHVFELFETQKDKTLKMIINKFD